MKLPGNHNGANQPQAIVFDFGGVLMDWDPRYLYRKLFNGDQQAMERFFAEVNFFAWNERQDAGRSFAEAVAELCAQFPAYREMIQAFDYRWEESVAGPIQPTVEILGDLHRKGYTLYGLSNWSAETFPLVRRKFPFFDWFEEIVISGEVKLAKPDPEIFSVLLRLVDRPAGECLLIDDAEENIHVAEELGFHTLHYQSPHQLRQELVALGIL
jgi:2-haloacid dehalogenase